MNKDRAVDCFVEHIGRLSRLPLVTDDEIRWLFGNEVATELDRLSVLDLHEGICSRCGDKCCRTVRCELYSSRFGACPIHGLRPALCRLHYCARFGAENSAAIKELGNIFFDGLVAAQQKGIEWVKWFDSPPLAAGCPRLVAAASPLVDAVEKGRLDPGRAAHLIREEAEKHRTPVR